MVVFIVSIKQYDLAVYENLFTETSHDSTISYTRENSKVFNITSNYFGIFNNTPTAGDTKIYIPVRIVVSSFQ